MTTHHNVTHLGRRDHRCPREHCNSAFGYKHLLQRHLAKVHSTQTGESDSAEPTDEEEEDEQAMPTGKVKDIQRMDINSITGMTYATQARERLMASKALRCPHPHLGELVAISDEWDADGASQSKSCNHVFSRAYDLRRHLRAEHGVHVEKERVDKWVKGAMAKGRKNVIL